MKRFGSSFSGLQCSSGQYSLLATIRSSRISLATLALATAAGSASGCSAAKLSGVRFVARTDSAMPAAKSCLTFLHIICSSLKEGLFVGKDQFTCRRVPFPAAALRDKSSTLNPHNCKSIQISPAYSSNKFQVFTMCHKTPQKKDCRAQRHDSLFALVKMRRGAYSSLSSSSPSSSSSSVRGL